MTDVPICALPQPDGPCREARYLMPDGTFAKRCERHLGLNELVGSHDPFSAQRVDSTTAGVARLAMINAVIATIVHLVDRGILRLPHGEVTAGFAPRRAAAVVVDDLAVHVLTQTLGGMAAGSVQPS